VTEDYNMGDTEKILQVLSLLVAGIEKILKTSKEYVSGESL